MTADLPACAYCRAPHGGSHHVYGVRKCCPDCDHTPRCWTCGTEMDLAVWQGAPREPAPWSSLRTCGDCFYVIDGLADPLQVMNMIRCAAGVPTVGDR